MKKILLVVLLIVLGALGWLLFKSEKVEPSSDKPMVKIGIIYPMSGNGAIYGDTAKVVVKQFFDDFNKKDHKYDYKVMFEDNQMNLATNMRLANKLLELDNVDVLVTFMSGYGVAVAPVAQNKDVIHIGIGTDPDMANYEHTMMVTNDSETKGKLLYEQLVTEGAKVVDIVIQNQVGTQSWLKYFTDAVNEGGKLTIKNTYSINDNEKDFKIILEKIKRDNPDYIVGILTTPTGDIFLKQYRTEGITIPFAGGETFNFLHDKTLAEGMWQVDSLNATSEFEERLLNETKSTSTNFGEYLDTLLQVVTWAYENAKTEDKEDIIDYIIKNGDKLSTSMGSIKITPEGIIKGKMILKRVKNGKLVPM